MSVDLCVYICSDCWLVCVFIYSWCGLVFDKVVDNCVGILCEGCCEGVVKK